MGPNDNGKPQHRSTRVKNCLRTFLAHLFSHIGLCVLVVGYAIVGAAIFERLEKGFEVEQRNNKQLNWNLTFKQIREQYVNELWNITEQFNVLYEKNWTTAVEQELRRFEDAVVEAVATAEQHGYDSNTRKADLHWSFPGALLYSVSIITTIGYGNTVPRTAFGKILTMFYAVIGVPLMLLWLSNIGTLMANTFKFAYTHICCPKKSDRSRSVHKRSPSFKQEPSSIQVKYSVSAKTCETRVVQQQQQQQLHHISPTDSSNFHGLEKQQRAGIRREQRQSFKGLDPATKQMLRECAEYNVTMSQDERSRMVLQQLHAAEHSVGSMAGIEEELSDDDDHMVDVTSSMILPPPVNIDGIEIEDYPCRPPMGVMSTSVGVSVGSVNGSMGRAGGSGSQLSQVEGTPSRVPLLHRGGDGGPDVVDVETLDEYGGESIEISVRDRCESPLASDRVPISLVLIFVVFYIMVGAMVFSVWEDWSFLDSAYFCFITLSTIGLGDYVPGRSLEPADSSDGHAQLIACCLYLVLGLAIIAMSFNLVQEEVVAKVKDIARHVGIIKDSSGNR